MKKRFLAMILAAVMVGATCAFTACGSNDKPEKQAYVSLDINPSVELIVDKDNKVVSVRGTNEDGQVLLYEEAGIKGESVDSAVEKITDLAVKYGYLNENNKVVDTTVSSGDKEFAKEISAKVDASVTATAKSLGLTVTTDCEGAFSLLRKMEEVKKQFPDNKAVQNVSVAKFKLALSASETGSISIDAAIELDDAELIEMLKKASAKIEEYATEAYLAAKEQALAVYDKAIELSSYAVYTQYCVERMVKNPTPATMATAYYSGVYQMYAAAAKSIDVACDVAEKYVQARNYPLDEEQITKIATALGMESVEPLKNANGDITIASIEAYADKLFKNTPASEQLEQVKAALTNALNEIEAVIKAKVNEITEEYKPQIEAVITGARQIADGVKTMLNALPENVKAELDNAIEDLNAILSDLDKILKGEKIEIQDLRATADRLEGKAKTYLDKVHESLSEEELKELDSRKEAAAKKLTAEKRAFEKALDDAAKKAKEYLKNLKDSIKNNPETI